MTRRTSIRPGETVVITPVDTARPQPPARPNRVPPPNDINTLIVDDDAPDRVSDLTQAVSGLTPPELAAAYASNNPRGLSPEAWVADLGLVGPTVDTFLANASSLIADAAAGPVGTGDTAEHAALRTGDTVEIPRVEPVRAEPVAPPPGYVDPVDAAAAAAVRARSRRIGIATVVVIPFIAAGWAYGFGGLMNMLYGFFAALGALVFVGPAIKETVEEGVFRFVTMRLWIETLAAVMMAVGLIFAPAALWQWCVTVAVVTLLFRAVTESALRTRAARYRPSVVYVEEVAAPAEPGPRAV